MRDLPSGTVTFLFTDIEGSTRLLHELGERYTDVLAEHRRVLREAFRRHGGVEVDTQGDAFFYAFARASDALAAVAEGQRGLAEASNTVLQGRVLVRMGVHTGEPTLTDEGYVGPDVHLAARVMSAGHGEQVLVSEATARLLAESNTVLLGDLGEHRLKDIERPVRLYQLGDGRYPPLKTLNNSNLPVPQTPLVGRKKELADVLRLLRGERERLVTVTGPGGIGKTRFALEAAHELIEDFTHGVWFVDLAPLRDPALVVPSVATTLGAKVELAEHVADKKLLLVLDNLEQVVETGPELARLLARCPNLHLLATSREPLRIGGEREYPLRPLSEAPAVELFRQRAEAARPDFEADYGTLVEICERLDRLPLAIELAAARTRLLSADALSERLEQRLPLLSGGARDLPERQRTLRAAIEWSYELLSADERQLFGRLAVFAGGFDLAVAEQVADADLDTLASLVEKSLVRRDGERFHMLETMREFAAERLAQTDERDRLERSLMLHIAARAEYADPWRRAGTAAEPDPENWRVAAAFAVRTGEDTHAANLALAAPEWRLAPSEVIRWIDTVLAETAQPAGTRAQLLQLRAVHQFYAGDVEASADSADQALRVSEKHGDVRGRGRALGILGMMLLHGGELERAEDTLRAALAAAEKSGDAAGAARALHFLGEVMRERGELTEARAVLERALAELRRHGSRTGPTLHGLGDVALEQGDLAAARRFYGEALREAKRERFEYITLHALGGLAAVSAADGEATLATELWRAAKTLEHRHGLRMGSPERDRYERRLGDVTAAASPDAKARDALDVVDDVLANLD